MDMEIKKPDRNWKESVKTIIEMGRFLERMKGNFSRADMAKMARIDFAIDDSSIDKIIKISQHPILSNPENCDKLPQGWGTLYELKFLPDDILMREMNAGNLKQITKYGVWELRGVKTKERSNSSNHGGKIVIDSQKPLVEYVRDGMVGLQEELTEPAVDEIAKRLKIGVQSFRMIRGMIILSERPELTETDRAMVLGLLEKVNRTRNVREYYQQVRPLMDGIWGPSRNKSLTDKASQKRVEIFRNAIVILRDTSDRILEMDQPYMSVEDIDKSINDLTEIRRNVGKLAENLRRSKND